MLITVLLILMLLVPVILVLCVLYWTADFRRPCMKVCESEYDLTKDSESFKQCSGGWLLHNDHGLWEAYVAGTPEARGGSLGSMCRDLLAYQEDAFVGYIRTAVKSSAYMRVLYWLTIVFIRRMAGHIPEEYRREINALSAFCGHTYDIFCNSYIRQLSYHAAHDIGHFMQDYMLVGCTSFAVWGGRSHDGKLLLARNFDFSAGDDFSRNRIVLFSSPDTGYRYVSVCWPGMVGAVSGMNEKGLTVTLNASKGRIPFQATAPVSILARHILQYASDIQEAMEIASTFKTFVPETFLIGSHKDDRAAVIEKTHDGTYLYGQDDEMIICTNHFQSSAFDYDKHNIRNKERSDSLYRFNRVRELILAKERIGVEDAVEVLRDRKGIGGKELGYGHQKAINQLMAHHSVVFSPSDLKMWVSTSPWQSGEFICYDLNEVFSSPQSRVTGMVDKKSNIKEETGFVDEVCSDVFLYRSMAADIRNAVGSKMIVDETKLEKFTSLNADYYETYELIGDYRLSQGDRQAAVGNWKIALEKELPTMEISEKIRKKIKRYDKKQRNSI